MRAQDVRGSFQRRRTGSGRIAARRSPLPASFIGAEDLTPIKARILLMLALAQMKDLADIQRMFTQY